MNYQDEKSFTESFDRQLNDLEKKGRRFKKRQGNQRDIFDLQQQQEGFNQEEFNLFEPSQITINTKLDLTDDSLNRSKDSKRKYSPKQSFERINSQEFKQQLDLIEEEPRDQQANVGSQQNMASSSPNSSEIFSKMAVLDNQNPL